MQRLFVTTLSLMLVAAPAVTSAKNKIRVCHEGKTLLIDVAAVREHRGHGDTPGPCSSDAEKKADVEPDTEAAPDTRPDRPELTAEPGGVPVEPVQEPEMEFRPDRKRHDAFRPDPEFLPETSDNGLDNILIKLNRTAGGRLDKYIVDLSSAFNIPREKVVYLIYNERIQPADVFMILQTARLGGQPYQELVPQFKKHRREGWRTVVRSLGIQPGSGKFVSLKKDIPQVMRHYAVWEDGFVSQPAEPQPQIEQHVDFQLDRDFRPHTGDREFDSLLIELNRTAGGRLDKYIVDLSSAFNIPREKVVYLIYTERMQPADVFMILQTARLSGRPYRKLVRRFKKHRREGWGAVVLSLGIKPGSRTFILLQEDIPQVVRHYVVTWKEEPEPRWEKGSKKKKKPKKKKGSKWKKRSKKKKGSKRR
ncbi:MAG: hypothetical protein ACL93V_16135 [Candidatus Electrothrix sp. YB6]